MKTLFAPLGAVVRVWFPETESVMLPGPKFRPCLVLAVDHEGSIPRVLVAYGTSQQTQRCALGEFTAPRSMLPDLEKDTKFCLTKAIWLPLTREYFAVRGRQPSPAAIPPGLIAVMRRAYLEAQSTR